MGMRGSLPYCGQRVTLWRIVIPSPTKHFYIANGKVQNKIQVTPTAKLTFMGRVYNTGSKLAFQLRPHQVVQILSTGALTNTKSSPNIACSSPSATSTNSLA